MLKRSLIAPPVTRQGLDPVIEKASAKVLQRRPTYPEIAAIQAAHVEGQGATGKDGETPTAVGNYRWVDIYNKSKILHQAGLGSSEIRALMKAGIVGLSAAEGTHYAIATDLFNGKIVDSKPFNENGNQTTLYKVKVKNEQTGRTRDAFFKPRSFGDGEGWDRTPIEYVAYELNRMLGMDHVPPAAYRKNIQANFEQYDEGVLLYCVPDAHLLNKVKDHQWGVDKDLMLSDTRVLDVLIQNSDRHHGNFLRGKHWANGKYRPALIDHAAGFRKDAYVSLEHNNAFGTGAVTTVRKSTLDGLKKLDFDQLKSAFGEFLSDQEIGDIVSRRDGMVKYFENLAGQKGVENVVKND